MSALALGLVAAFAWGLHDICVRSVSQTVPLMASLLTVLVTAAGFHVALIFYSGGFTSVPAGSVVWATVSGFFFLVASLGLYGAFQRGPVRLVSPIIASFPILSVGWAALSGAEVSALQWLAVIAIIAGVSVVAVLSDDSAGDVPPRGPTILYAAIASAGFAASFATGHIATELADDLPVILITRLVAIALLVALMLARRLPVWPGRKAVPVLAFMGLMDAVALICVLSAGDLPNAQYASVAASIFGLLTIVMAWALLGERLRPLQWGGCAVTFGGIGYLAL